MNGSTPGLPVHHHLPEFTHTHVHRVSDAIQPSDNDIPDLQVGYLVDISNMKCLQVFIFSFKPALFLVFHIVADENMF